MVSLFSFLCLFNITKTLVAGNQNHNIMLDTNTTHADLKRLVTLYNLAIKDTGHYW